MFKAYVDFKNHLFRASVASSAQRSRQVRLGGAVVSQVQGWKGRSGKEWGKAVSGRKSHL